MYKAVDVSYIDRTDIVILYNLYLLQYSDRFKRHKILDIVVLLSIIVSYLS